MRKIAVVVALGLLTVAASCPIPIPVPGGGEPFDCDTIGQEQAPFLISPTGRYIVRARSTVRGVMSVNFQTLSSRYNMRGVRTLSSINGWSVEMSPERARALHENEGSVIVEPDGVKSISSTGVTTFGALPAQTVAPSRSTRAWGLTRIDQRDLPLDDEYNPIGNGVDVHCYILDTGIDSDHPDFTDRLGEGFSSVPTETTPEDLHGHGSHVAGTCGGAQFGVANRVILHAVKVLDRNGSGSDSGVIQGIEWVQQHVTANGWKAVANMSLGGSTSDALDTALCKLIKSGVAVAVAAGNDGLDACATSPARVKQALTMGATDKSDNLASFSNVGACVDALGPGVDVLSVRRGGGETTFSGTSMASPHGAGVLALALEVGSDDPKATVLAWSTKDTISLPSNTETPNQFLYIGRE